MRKSIRYIIAAAAAMFTAAVASAQVVNSKTAKDNGDGTYTLTLESFATGSLGQTISTSRKPIDAVLVLDVSGSMAYTIPTFEPLASASYSYSSYGRSSYYFRHTDGKYYKVSRGSSGNGKNIKYYLYYTVTDTDTDYYLSGNSVTTSKPSVSSDQTTTIWTGVLYKYKQIKKLDALKDACKAFVESIAKDAEENNVEHRISLVKFSSFYGDGSNETVVTLANGSVKTNKSGLINSIKAFNAEGATEAHEGMRLAAEQISKADPNATKLVVMFTDGKPTSWSEFDNEVAGKAINYSKQIKDNNAKVYSIGIFNDEDYTDEVGEYMNYLSSNYPSAKCTDFSNWLFTGVGATDAAVDKKYYSRVDNSEALTGVFEGIASESVKGGADVEMETSQTEVKDILSSSFVLPEGTSTKDIRVSIADFDDTTPLDASEADYKFKTPDTASDVTVEIGEKVIDGETLQTISVKNFDFSKNWCGPITVNKNGVVTKSWHPGKKLIFSFEIVPNPSAVGGLVTTNHPESGVYYKNKLTNEFGSVAFEVPAPQYTPMDLIIRKKGLNPGESAIFEVTRSVNGSRDPGFKITVVMTAGSEGATDDAVIVKTPVRDENKVDYVYIVKETSWSWAYKQTEALSHSLYKADGSADNVFEFTNVTKTDLPKHSEKAKNNVFE
ncbi:MAG: VWA domain-containing protein [Bacteroidales bacterium]|nr:VWA domain-containing protein [Bacteroidales bacterium]